jgi:hypothetical protein
MWIAMIAAVTLSAGTPIASAQDLRRAFADLAPPGLAAEECERPEPDESYCGFVNGACIYCPADRPHFCPNVETCFSSVTAAKSACGWMFLKCTKSQ